MACCKLFGRGGERLLLRCCVIFAGQLFAVNYSVACLIQFAVQSRPRGVTAVSVSIKNLGRPSLAHGVLPVGSPARKEPLN